MLVYASTPRFTASIAGRAVARTRRGGAGRLGELAEQVDDLAGPAHEVAGRHLAVDCRWRAPWPAVSPRAQR